MKNVTFVLVAGFAALALILFSRKSQTRVVYSSGNQPVRGSSDVNSNILLAGSLANIFSNLSWKGSALPVTREGGIPGLQGGTPLVNGSIGYDNTSYTQAENDLAIDYASQASQAQTVTLDTSSWDSQIV